MDKNPFKAFGELNIMEEKTVKHLIGSELSIEEYEELEEIFLEIQRLKKQVKGLILITNNK